MQRPCCAATRFPKPTSWSLMTAKTACSLSTTSIASLHLFAEIGSDDLRIGTHDVRCAAHENWAVEQHRDAVGKRKDRRHIVLDEQHGKAPLESGKQCNEALTRFTASA